MKLTVGVWRAVMKDKRGLARAGVAHLLVGEKLPALPELGVGDQVERILEASKARDGVAHLLPALRDELARLDDD